MIKVNNHKCALIIVDVQVDFCPGGGYPVPDGNKIIKPINRLLKHARENNWLIVFSRDWHPPGMNHCVMDTKGAQFHPDLKITKDDIVVSKGQDTSDKHYSAFNGDNISLHKLLNKNQINKLYIAGLATDYCVLKTALDAVKNNYKTNVIIDACRAVNKNGTSEKQALTQMETHKIMILNSEDIIKKI